MNSCLRERVAFPVRDGAVTEQVLHVMADFVGDDVGLRELGLGAAQLLFEFVEKSGIEIDRLVGGAVERADGAWRGAARGVNCAWRKGPFPAAHNACRPCGIVRPKLSP